MPTESGNGNADMSLTLELEIKDGCLIRPILSGEEIKPNVYHGFEVIIPEDVVEIADDAFNSVPGFCIRTLKLPKNLRRIGHRAFKNAFAPQFRYLTLPKHLEFIGDEAFWQKNYFWGVKSINVPDSVRYIGYGAFFNFIGLKKLKLGKGLTHIGEAFVAHGWNLESIISDNPAVRCDENSLVWQNKLIAVWGELDSYTVPSEIEEIGDRAFTSCRNMSYGPSLGPKEIILPEGLRRIGNYAFSGVRLQQLHIPDSVQEVGLNPICDCPVKKLSGKFTYDGRAIIWGNHLRAHISSADSNEIPDHVETLDILAFPTLRQPAAIVIPSSVKEIGTRCFYHAKIKELTFNEGLQKIDDEAFFWCDGLSEITFPSTLKELGSETFGYAKNLKGIIFKEAVPPKFPDCVIRHDNFKGIIRVPADSIDAYRKAFPELITPTPEYPDGRILEINDN